MQPDLPEPPRRLEKREWPKRLLDLPSPPRELYLSGAVPGPPYVAVVGTRRPSTHGVGFAEALAAELARAGAGVLSGGAAGIDAAAHRGVLDAGGCTLVVAPAGWNRPFPPEHSELFREVVARGGGYLSLCSPDETATRARFFSRNACLVALAHVVVVVEAGYRSGARNAAKHARSLGRKLFVVPSAPWIPSGRGCIAELKAGAAPLESVKDVLAYLASHNLHLLGPQLGLPLGEASPVAMPPSASLPSASLPSETPPTNSEDLPSNSVTLEGSTSTVTEGVFRAIQSGACTYDAICGATGLSLRDVQEAVFDLRVARRVQQDPMGFLMAGRL